MMADFLTLEGEKAVFMRGGLVKSAKTLLPFHLCVLAQHITLNLQVKYVKCLEEGAPGSTGGALGLAGSLDGRVVFLANFTD